MSFTSRSGVCNFYGPPSWSDPFARDICFEPSYIADTEDLNCQTIYTQGVQACYYDKECGDSGKCVQGQCWSTKTPGNPWAYRSNNPRIIKEMSWNDLFAFSKATGMSQQFEQYAKSFAHGDKMYLAEQNGEQFVITPLNVVYFNQEPNCSNCLKSIWQCSRYKDQANYSKEAKMLYNQCQELESCFLFDVISLTGHLIPLCVKMNGTCQGAVKAALQKCSESCGGGQVFDTLALS